jgi:2-oxoglutarate ferredoxin oxidoreductase subunit alpha
LGLIAVDSDEHDQAGHISENLDLRVRMVDKRLNKLELLKKEAMLPELVGKQDYRVLIICWGTTYPIIKEAIEALRMKEMSILYFRQAYPVHEETLAYLKRAKVKVIVENNATSQLGRLLKCHTGMDMDYKILKYNGLPFSVEELIERLNEIVERLEGMEE